ncbi:MAG: prolyl oligopeptidase family serine peptidase [Caldithrix sp.]|nr:prolyl oligopeptidase family serine peptidase [Caldithrix sp.]
MNLKRYVLSILFFAGMLAAQNGQLTMKEAITGGYNKLQPATIEQLTWIASTNQFSFIDTVDNKAALVKASPENENIQTIITLDSLNRGIAGMSVNEQKKFPRIHWINADQLYFWISKQLLSLDVRDGQFNILNDLPEEAKNTDIDTKQLNVAYTIDNNLYIGHAQNGQKQITFADHEGIVYGQYVSRVEFGIRKGTFWSPDGNYLAFYKKDESGVSQYPLVDIDTRPAHMTTSRYPMAGQTSEKLAVGVYDMRSGSITYLQTGQPKDHYLTNITWSPDERFIYVVELNRDQDHLKLIQYDPISGLPVKTIFEEKDEQYVEPLHGPLFSEKDAEHFLWFSKRDGFNHLYLYDINGHLIHQVTKGNFDITTFDGYSIDGKYCFVTAASKDGMQRHGYKIEVDSGDRTKLTKGNGIHRLSPSPDGHFIIDRFNNIDTPNNISLRNEEGKLVRVLLNAENPLSDYDLGTVEFLKLKNENSTNLNARIILPPDFKPDQSYPVIVYLYGGPHGQMITNHWIGGWRLWFHYMAQRGFIVFSLDNRGTNNRGIEFEQAVFRQLGTKEMADQRVGIDYLKSLDYVDSTRIGIHGWSYGGFLTITMMTRQPGVFKAGAAGGPVIDWRYYEVMYGERYMDTPQANPEGYENANLLNYVEHLDGHLLIIHGTMDPTVVWQHSLLYLKKAVDMGKQLDYFVYPGHGHNVRGEDRIHLYQKITDYFNSHLK